ncbi:MAG: protein kinase [Proteobacteria bacterium]|jgi:serine/threonine-protein kinase|nr:protein kinase [Pseudomonadota bacterium]
MKACPKCGKRFLGNEEFCPNDGQTLAELDEKKLEDPLVGTTIDGRYNVEKKLGEGGMGVVYLAKHAVIGNKCALKILRGELTGEGEVSERFIQEARAAAAIGNDHIIQITDFGQLPDGAAYFVMEFLDGKALHDVIGDCPKMEPKRALNIMVQCCEGLAAAHASDIVHRDLKPDNIFLVRKGGVDDFVKVLDFGIAKVQAGEGGKRLTKTGMIFGTPQYMSPEQAAGSGVDARTDIYSLGIIMYEMLCGHVPFEADTFMGVLTKHLYEEPIPPRRLVPPIDMPHNLEAVLLKAIAKKPDKRYQSMDEFAEDLRAVAEGKTPEIVYDQMRDTSTTTVPPPSPNQVVGAKTTAWGRDDRPQSKPKWPIFAGLGAVVVLGIVAAVLFFGFGGKGTEAAASSGKTPLQAPVAPVTPPEKPEPAEVAPPVVAPPVETPAVVSIIKVTSVPTGAELFLGNALMGKLPFDLVKPKAGDAPVTYTLKLDGYTPREVVISSGTPEAFEVELERIKKSGGSKKSGESGTSGGKSAGESSGDEPTKVKVKKGGGDKHSDLADPWG